MYDEKQDGKICKGLGECTQEDDFKDASSTCCRAVSTQVGEVDSNKDTVVSEGTCADGSKKTWRDNGEGWGQLPRSCPEIGGKEYKLMTVNNCESTPCTDADFFDYTTDPSNPKPGPCCEAVIGEDELKRYASAEGFKWVSQNGGNQRSAEASELVRVIGEKISALVKQAPGSRLTKTQWEKLDFEPFKKILVQDPNKEFSYRTFDMTEEPIFTTTKFDEIFNYPKT